MNIIVLSYASSSKPQRPLRCLNRIRKEIYSQQVFYIYYTSPLDELVKVVYDDVNTSLHKMAMLSLSAHLIKLRQEQRARLHAEDETWSLVSE